jgi:hypothetical protein
MLDRYRSADRTAALPALSQAFHWIFFQFSVKNEERQPARDITDMSTGLYPPCFRSRRYHNSGYIIPAFERRIYLTPERSFHIFMSLNIISFTSCSEKKIAPKVSI